MPLTTSELLMHSVVRLTTFSGGVPVSNGTGFYRTAHFADGSTVNLIVTNKHVIAGADSIHFVVHMLAKQGGEPSGELAEVIVPLDGVLFAHPDATVDLCAIAITRTLHDLYNSGRSPFTVQQADETIPTGDEWDAFDGIEEVLMLGCPSGLYDQVNNLPICRQGITATPLTKNYNGRREFVIDMACFPGSSGSPIFVYNRDGYLNRSQNTYMMGESRLKLVGILYAGPNINNRGEIVMAVPTVNIQTMMHLGYAIKADRLFDIDDLIGAAIGSAPRRLQGNAIPPPPPDAAV